MSGFAGLIRLDGQPADRADAGKLAGAIAERGGDASGEWISRSAILAHASFHTTPESLHEQQPHIEGDITVAGDLRIDNRDHLITTLSVDPRADQSIGDAELIVAAYRHWGFDFARHIDGDFAVALVDGDTVVLARDAFGVKPLVHAHLPGKLFAFASNIRALLALDEVPRRVDERRLADFLLVYFDDFERTFYRDIQRLPGGCTLILRKGQKEIRRWWSPRDIAPERKGSDDEFAAEFHDLFVRAVRSRMRLPIDMPIGAMLSGGLDSSAISCVARDEVAPATLPVFSWVFSDVLEADEREFQELVAAQGGMSRHVIDSATAGYSPWSDLDRLLPDGPPYAPNHYLNLAMGQMARREGIRVLLDGLGGDSSISRGGARFNELFARGRWISLSRELRSFAKLHHASLFRVIAGQLLAPLAPHFLIDFYRTLRGKKKEGRVELLRPKIAALSEGSRGPRHRRYFSVREEHISQFESPLLAEGLELFDRVMAVAGAEGRYPFFDRRLVEFCVSLPADQKLAGGYSRIVARRALAGIVPDAALWRPGKGLPGLHFIVALRAGRERLDELFLRDPSALEPYADIDRLRVLYQRFVEGSENDILTAVRLWSAASATLWLRTLG